VLAQGGSRRRRGKGRKCLKASLEGLGLTRSQSGVEEYHYNLGHALGQNHTPHHQTKRLFWVLASQCGRFHVDHSLPDTFWYQSGTPPYLKPDFPFLVPNYALESSKKV
jgi:hypothetical protein